MLVNLEIVFFQLSKKPAAQKPHKKVGETSILWGKSLRVRQICSFPVAFMLGDASAMHQSRDQLARAPFDKSGQQQIR